MLTMNSLNYVVVGLGVTGLSCARYLQRQGCRFSVMDTRENAPNAASFAADFPGVSLTLGAYDTERLHQADVIVLSPGIALSTPEIQAEIKRGAKVVGDIELFAEAVKAPVIAITGTNAKSTVTTLVGLMMEAAGYQTAVGGNLGVPALDLLASEKPADVYVLELSSFQLETTASLRPAVAALLNITPDHLDRHETYEAYQAAKHRVFLGATQAVCYLDDPLTHAKTTPTTFFTMQTPKAAQFGLAKHQDQLYLAEGSTLLMPVSGLPVIGKHYQANALAALAIGHAFGLKREPLLHVLKTFQGLPHRCQWVREREGVRWYNDSKGTNVGASQAAIEGVGATITGKLILIAGGVGKGADFSGMLPAMSAYVRHVVLMGEAADEIAAVVQNHLPYTLVNSMEAAVMEADRVAKPGDCVLLSPACASFDMFQNYEHRGNVFTEIVAKL
jgi:UDP-N-acetylmuramoylalanine--D-glutamate ligase